jgi:hypothetical protein
MSELRELMRVFRVDISPDAVSLLPKVTLCTLLLLSSGFIYQLTDEGHRAYLDSEMDYATFSDSEESGAIWEENFGQAELGFECRASDYYRSKLLGKHIRAHVDESERGLNGAKYIFLSGYNLEYGQYYTSNVGSIDYENAFFQHIEIDSELIDGTGTSSRIFDSGEAHWYYTGVCSKLGG